MNRSRRNKRRKHIKLIGQILFCLILIGIPLTIALSNPPAAPGIPDTPAVRPQEDQNTYTTVTTTTTQPRQPLSVHVVARSAYMVDLTDNFVLFSKGADQQVSPASTAKLVTALTVLRHCDPTEVAHIGDEIETYVESDSSRAYIEQGRDMSVRDLLAALLLPSGNDAAYTLAVHVGEKLGEGDSIAQFVQEMNRTAASIGANASNFCNPDGYDAEGQYTTAADMAIIAQHCLENETIASIVKEMSITAHYADGEDITFENTNWLLDPGSEYYAEGAIGLKTGYTETAGACLVSAAVQDGRTYVCVVMGSDEDNRFTDTLALLHEAAK